MMVKQRKLYQVRYFEGGRFSKQVGFKTRLVPRAAAMKIAKRLRKALKKLDMLVTVTPILVNCTPEQIAYLERRYGK
jgi:aspartyl-tRNA synthetase